MTRALAILIGLALAALGFFAALADAEPETVFYAQTAVILFIVVLAVVGVATLVTYLYMKSSAGSPTASPRSASRASSAGSSCAHNARPRPGARASAAAGMPCVRRRSGRR